MKWCDPLGIDRLLGLGRISKSLNVTFFQCKLARDSTEAVCINWFLITHCEMFIPQNCSCTRIYFVIAKRIKIFYDLRFVTGYNSVLSLYQTRLNPFLNAWIVSKKHLKVIQHVWLTRVRAWIIQSIWDAFTYMLTYWWRSYRYHPQFWVMQVSSIFNHWLGSIYWCFPFLYVYHVITWFWSVFFQRIQCASFPFPKEFVYKTKPSTT